MDEKEEYLDRVQYEIQILTDSTSNHGFVSPNISKAQAFNPWLEGKSLHANAPSLHRFVVSV